VKREESRFPPDPVCTPIDEISGAEILTCCCEQFRSES
jgi:hypothetical protein